MSKNAKAKPNPEAEWFGFRAVDPREKSALVGRVFSSVASNYDVMNDLMSGGLHRLWKDEFVRRIRPRAGQTMLDVAGGTGDIALRCHKKTGGAAAITVCDINPEMLKRGKAKALDQGVTTIAWVVGDAENLPCADNSMDIYSIAFGLRNVTRIDQALREAARVLKPGGRFFCLEFSPGVAPRLKPFYQAYCLNILPLIGQFVAKDRDAYQYLAESIMKFPPQAELAKRMAKAGLEQVQWTNLTGGIAVIHQGWRL